MTLSKSNFLTSRELRHVKATCPTTKATVYCIIEASTDSVTGGSPVHLPVPVWGYYKPKSRDREGCMSITQLDGGVPTHVSAHRGLVGDAMRYFRDMGSTFILKTSSEMDLREQKV